MSSRVWTIFKIKKILWKIYIQGYIMSSLNSWIISSYSTIQPMTKYCIDWNCYNGPETILYVFCCFRCVVPLYVLSFLCIIYVYNYKNPIICCHLFSNDHNIIITPRMLAINVSIPRSWHPYLFTLYVDDLIGSLRLSGYRLYIGCLFVGCLLYADDIVLLSPSCFGLRYLISVCLQFGSHWDIRLNPLKSQPMTFGGDNPIIDINMNGLPIPWASKVKYLGVWFLCNSERTDLTAL